MKVDEMVIEPDTAHNAHENHSRPPRTLSKLIVDESSILIGLFTFDTIYQGCFKKEAKLSSKISSEKSEVSPFFQG